MLELEAKGKSVVPILYYLFIYLKIFLILYLNLHFIHQGFLTLISMF